MELIIITDITAAGLTFSLEDQGVGCGEDLIKFLVDLVGEFLRDQDFSVVVLVENSC